MKTNRKKRKRYLDPGILFLVKQVFLGIFVFTIITALLASIWYVTRLDFFTLEDITVEGGYTIDKNLVKTKAEAELTGDYLKLIPKKFSYFYPKDKLLLTISEVPRIKDVVVERKSRNGIHISFEEYLPDALWCNPNPSDQCYFIDDLGYAFSPAPNLLGSSLVRYISLENENDLKHNLTEPENYIKTKQFIDLVSQIGWFVTRVELDAVGDVFYTFERGGEVKASLVDESDKVVKNLQTILESDEFSHLDPGTFLYVDLRFGSRIFVNEEITNLLEYSTTTATTTVEDVGLETLLSE